MGSTARQVSNAVGLIIAGAMRDVDNGGGDARSASEIFFAVMRELKDWVEGETEIARMMADELADAHGGYCTWPEEDVPLVKPE